MKFSRILPFLVFCVFGKESKSKEIIACQNGGQLDEGVCVCPSEFTGPDCGSAIDAEKSVLKVDESADFETCFTTAVVSGNGEIISGFGSNEECEENMLKIREKCQKVALYEGSVTWLNASEVILDEESICALNSIFQEVPLAEILIESVTKQEVTDEVVVGFVIKSAEHITIDDLTDVIAKIRVNDVIKDLRVQDYDECARDETDCDPSAVCLNTGRDYLCVCPRNSSDISGIHRRPGSKCRPFCEDEHGDELCHNGGVCRITTDGKELCDCPRDFTGRRCSRNWKIYLWATIGLAIGCALIFLIFLTIIVTMRRKKSVPISKSNSVELAHDSRNGAYQANLGISNPYVSSEEGITIATKIARQAANEIRNGKTVEDDKL